MAVPGLTGIVIEILTKYGLVVLSNPVFIDSMQSSETQLLVLLWCVGVIHEDEDEGGSGKLDYSV